MICVFHVVRSKAELSVTRPPIVYRIFHHPGPGSPGGQGATPPTAYVVASGIWMRIVSQQPLNKPVEEPALLVLTDVTLVPTMVGGFWPPFANFVAVHVKEAGV